jgi:hypothetical protein
VYVGLCFLVAVVGKTRPLRFWGYFFASFILTPFVGLLLLLAAGRKRLHHPDSE